MKFLRHHFWAMLPLGLSLPLWATPQGISLGQTRVIFSGVEKTSTVMVSNTEERAWLVQVRIQNAPDDATAAPFIATPPLFSLAGDSRQLVRILPQDATLPADRESLFYLSVSAVPAQSDPVTTDDRLSVGIRFVVKMFYRPAGIAPYGDAEACRLTFHYQSRGLRIANPTPYFQTLGNVSINGRPLALDPARSMVAPYESLVLEINHPTGQALWQTITDYGGLSRACHQPVEGKS